MTCQQYAFLKNPTNHNLTQNPGIVHLVSCWAVVEATWALDGLLLGDRDDVDWDSVELRIVRQNSIDTHMNRATYAKGLEELFGIGIDLKLSSLALGEIKSRYFWYVLILALTLLLLEFEGNTTDRTTLNTLHQMCGETSNLFQFPVRPYPDYQIW